MGSLEAPCSLGNRAGESPSLMSEQLALQQRRRNRRAVNCYEPLLPARAGIMNSPCNHFLASARLASDQHGAIRGCYCRHLFENSREAVAGSNEFRRCHRSSPFDHFSPNDAKGGSIGSEVLNVIISFCRLLRLVRFTLRPLFGNPFTDIGGTIPELHSPTLARRKELHAISVDERDVLEIDGYCAGFL